MIFPMAAAQSMTVAAIYQGHQMMRDTAYTTPESSDIATVLFRHKVLDMRRQNAKVIQHIRLPKLTASPPCTETFGKMKGKFPTIDARQDPVDSE